MTNSILRRIFEHKTKATEGFTSKYKLDRLVYWERYTSVHRAIAREKQIKGWLRIKKIQLIVEMNPTWKDLAADWPPHLNA
jgi:putative endonuclease